MLSRFLAALLFASAVSACAAPHPTVMTWNVDGVQRQAIVVAPSGKSGGKAPLIFSFHGHGDNMQNFSGVSLEAFWPEAVVVYAQGLPSSRSPLDIPGYGWQVKPGEYGDRDLKFVDAMLADLEKKFNVDRTRIYSTGFSNGANFTYLLWSQRANVFAAFAPVAARISDGTHLSEPRPLLHIAGRADQQIAFKDQQTAIETARKTDNAEGRGQPCGTNCTLYTSPSGAPVMTIIHDGGHVYPAEASGLIVKFFQAHSLPAGL